MLADIDYPRCDFVDCFAVARVAGHWLITNKTFAHTGAGHPGSNGAARRGLGGEPIDLALGRISTHGAWQPAPTMP